MALTIPHPSRTGSNHMTLIASVVVVMGSLAFGGYQFATAGDSAGTTSPAVQAVEDGTFPRSWWSGYIAPIEQPGSASSLQGVLNPGGQAAVGAEQVTRASDYTFANGGEAPEPGLFAPKVEAHPLAGLNEQWPTVAETTPERVGPVGNVN